MGIASVIRTAVIFFRLSKFGPSGSPHSCRDNFDFVVVLSVCWIFKYPIDDQFSPAKGDDWSNEIGDDECPPYTRDTEIKDETEEDCKKNGENKSSKECSDKCIDSFSNSLKHGWWDNTKRGPWIKETADS